MPITSECKADDLANELFTSLTADAPTPPSVDFTDDKFNYEVDTSTALYQDPDPITLEQLTENQLDGDGVFDVLMNSVDQHIQREFKGGRITGTEYAEVYTALVGAVLGQSTSFLLQKDKARWDAITAQMQARVAEIAVTEGLVNLEKVKAETQKMIFDMQNSGAQYGLTKMQIANANAQHCLTEAQAAGEEYKVKNLMPAELAIQHYQRMEVLPSNVRINKVQSDRILPAEAAMKEFTNREIQPLERDIQAYNLAEALPAKVGLDKYQLESLLPVTLGQEQHKLNTLMPAQSQLVKEQLEVQRAQTLDTRTDGLTPVSGVIGKQKEVLTQDIAAKAYNVDFVLPIQLDLVKEQREAERAKTLDTRTDNTTVTGSIGKQKDLYTQQIDSFVKDAQYKTAKMYLDSFITQKTLDEGLTPPTELDTVTLNTVMAGIRSTNNL